MSDLSDEQGGGAPAPTLIGTPTSPSSLPLSAPTTPTVDTPRVPDHLKVATKVKPPASYFLRRRYHEINDTGFHFRSLAEAEQSMTESQWRSPSNDVTIPSTDSDDRRVVAQLVNAAKDMSKAKDTMASAYRKKTHGYPDWTMEACAWGILSLVKNIHTEGFKGHVYDAPLMDAIGDTQFWTFQERIDWICEALMSSKNIVVNLMKNEKLLTIVGAPHKLYVATIVNTRSNAYRGIWVKSGREADPEHKGRPAAKRIAGDGSPLPAPKRLKKERDSPEDPFSSERQISFSSVSGTLTGGSPATPQRAVNVVSRGPPIGNFRLPMPHPFRNHLYNPGIPTTPAVFPAPSTPVRKDKKVEMADVPHQPIKSFTLDALNEQFSAKRASNRYHASRNFKASENMHPCNGIHSSLTVRPKLDPEAPSSHVHTGHNGNHEMGNATITPSKIVSVYGDHHFGNLGANEIDAAHILASMQHGLM